MKEGRSVGRRGLAVLVSILVAVLCLELGLRVVDARAGRDAAFYQPWDGQTVPLYIPHPYLGFALRPGYEVEEGKVQLRINSLGFRGAERTAEKPEGVYRVFCLGGSTTFGTGCYRDEETYPAQLEGFLQQMAPEGRTYEVWNCGVSGFNTVESLINLELRLLQFEPDAIVIYHAANDARPIQSRGFRPDYAHLRQAWTGTAANPLDSFLLRWSRIYAWGTRGTDAEEQGSALQNFVFRPGYQKRHIRSHQHVNEAGVDVFVRNLTHILAIAEENGIEAVLSTFAMAPSKDPNPAEHYFETVRVMNARIRDLAAQRGVALVDVAAELSTKPELFDDWMHFNPAGSRQHAAVVARAARQQGLFGISD